MVGKLKDILVTVMKVSGEEIVKVCAHVESTLYSQMLSHFSCSFATVILEPLWYRKRSCLHFVVNKPLTCKQLANRVHILFDRYWGSLFNS